MGCLMCVGWGDGGVMVLVTEVVRGCSGGRALLRWWWWVEKWRGEAVSEQEEERYSSHWGGLAVTLCGTTQRNVCWRPPRTRKEAI